MRKKNTASNSQKYVKKGSEQKGLCQPSPELLVDWKNRCCSLKKRHTWGGKKNPTSLKFMYRSLARYLFTPECWEHDEDSIDFVTLLSSVSQWDTLNRCIKHLFSLGLVKIKCCASAVQPYRILERNTLNSYIPPLKEAKVKISLITLGILWCAGEGCRLDHRSPSAGDGLWLLPPRKGHVRRCGRAHLASRRQVAPGRLQQGAAHTSWQRWAPIFTWNFTLLLLLNKAPQLLHALCIKRRNILFCLLLYTHWHLQYQIK